MQMIQDLTKRSVTTEELGGVETVLEREQEASRDREGSERVEFDGLKIDEILSLKEYHTQFTNRYTQEKTFRKMVHNHLELSYLYRAKLSLGKVFRKKWYESKSQDMITEYATRIRDELVLAAEIEKELIILREAELELKRKARTFLDVSEEEESAENEFEHVLSEENAKLETIKKELAEQKQKELQERAIQRARVQNQTDARTIVKESLKKQILDSTLIKKDSEGNLEFAEELIVQRLENMYLDEIIEGIEQDDGTGFFSKLKESYEGVLAYYAQMDDLEELHNVDWVKTIIESRQRGYSLPQFPYFIVGKSEDRAKASIDTAIVVDTSSSMKYSERFKVAQKTALANNALMRKLNPNNQSYLAEFNSELLEITSAKLMKEAYPRGWTRTDLALEWLLNKLIDRGPSIAYLITDGERECGNAKDVPKASFNVPATSVALTASSKRTT